MPTHARRNILLQSRINFLSGVVFLVPLITLFYKYVGLSLAQIIIITNISTLAVWLFELPTSVRADTAWRKKSLVVSVICNFIGALLILVAPSYTGFIVASIFSGLYFAFWSWTGQAFLEDNLRILWEESAFGKKIGHLMAMENLAGLITPLIASAILKFFWDGGYTILALLDVLSALALVILTLQLRELNVYEKLTSWKHSLKTNLETAKTAIKNVVSNKSLRLLLLYRSLANHVAFIFIISLPLRVQYGMPEWMAWVLATIGTVAVMLANKYTYKIWEKYSYNTAWVIATVSQAILLIFIGLFVKNWIVMSVLLVFFSLFEWMRQPAWNHVLVEQTQGKAIATTRSIIFSIFALYTTFGKQVLSFFNPQYALIWLGIFMLIVNILLGKKIIDLHSKAKIADA